MRIEKQKEIPAIELTPEKFAVNSGRHPHPDDTVVCTVETTVPGHKIQAQLPAPPDLIDTIGVVSLDDAELKQLGLKSGWASIFGESDILIDPESE